MCFQLGSDLALRSCLRVLDFRCKAVYNFLEVNDAAKGNIYESLHQRRIHLYEGGVTHADKKIVGGDRQARPDGRLGLAEGILLDPLRIIPGPLPELLLRVILLVFHREMVCVDRPVDTTWTTKCQPNSDGNRRRKWRW